MRCTPLASQPTSPIGVTRHITHAKLKSPSARQAEERTEFVPKLQFPIMVHNEDNDFRSSRDYEYYGDGSPKGMEASLSGLGQSTSTGISSKAVDDVLYSEVSTSTRNCNCNCNSI